MHNFYITISNGLLKDEHRKRMGPAIWEFVWCLDKVTRIDSRGVGWVLGGKPVNLKDIGMGVSDDTVSRNLGRLEDQGYITVIRTPYGISLRVHKAKKRFYKNAESVKKRFDENAVSLRKNVESLRKNAVSNKIVSVDSNSKIKELPLSEEQKKAIESKKEEIRKTYGTKP